MSARPIPFALLDETPRQIASLGVGEVQSIHVHNPNATGCYVKLYAKATAPNLNDVPIGAWWCPQGGTTHPVFVSGAQLWLVASTDFAAGLTAPAADVNATITFAPA